MDGTLKRYRLIPLHQHPLKWSRRQPTNRMMALPPNSSPSLQRRVAVNAAVARRPPSLTYPLRPMGKGSSCIKVRARMGPADGPTAALDKLARSTKLPGEQQRGRVGLLKELVLLLSSFVFSRPDPLSSSFPNLREATPRSLESPSLVQVQVFVSSIVLPCESPSFSRPRLPENYSRRKNKDP